MARKPKWEQLMEGSPEGHREVDGAGVRELIRAVQEVKGTHTLPVSFIVKFDKEWDAAVGRLKRAGRGH